MDLDVEMDVYIDAVIFNWELDFDMVSDLTLGVKFDLDLDVDLDLRLHLD